MQNKQPRYKVLCGLSWFRVNGIDSPRTVSPHQTQNRGNDFVLLSFVNIIVAPVRIKCINCCMNHMVALQLYVLLRWQERLPAWILFLGQWVLWAKRRKSQKCQPKIFFLFVLFVRPPAHLQLTAQRWRRSRQLQSNSARSIAVKIFVSPMIYSFKICTGSMATAQTTADWSQAHGARKQKVDK